MTDITPPPTALRAAYKSTPACTRAVFFDEGLGEWGEPQRPPTPTLKTPTRQKQQQQQHKQQHHSTTNSITGAKPAARKSSTTIAKGRKQKAKHIAAKEDSKLIVSRSESGYLGVSRIDAEPRQNPWIVRWKRKRVPGAYATPKDAAHMYLSLVQKEQKANGKA